jgi:hypothetical protein
VNLPSLLELCGFQRFGHAYFDLLLPSLLHASACPIVSRPWAEKGRRREIRRPSATAHASWNVMGETGESGAEGHSSKKKFEGKIRDASSSACNLNLDCGDS